MCAKVEGELFPLKNKELRSPYNSGASTSSSLNDNDCYSEQEGTSEQEKSYHDNEKQWKHIPNKKEKKTRFGKSSSSPEHETNGKADSCNTRKVSDYEREYVSVRRETEKSKRDEEQAKEYFLVDHRTSKQFTKNALPVLT